MSPALRCTADLLLIAVFAPDHHDVGGAGGGGGGGGDGDGGVFQRQCHSAPTYS